MVLAVLGSCASLEPLVSFVWLGSATGCGSSCGGAVVDWVDGIPTATVTEIASWSLPVGPGITHRSFVRAIFSNNKKNN